MSIPTISASLPTISDNLIQKSDADIVNKLELNLPESTTSKLVTQLSILDNDNSITSSYSISDILKERTGDVATAFTIANQGAAYSQITNVALEQQNNILDTIKKQLEDTKSGTITDEGREAIRQNITSLLEKFNNIAADTEYNKKYTLQNSSTDTSSSEIYTFQVSEFPPITISTIELQSNTQGLGLDTLKDLSQGELTYQVANTQSGVVNTAIDTIEDFQSQYISLLSSLKSNISSLNKQHFDFKTQASNLSESYDYKESQVFDKTKIINEMSSYSTIQANANQSSIIDLLSFQFSIEIVK